MERVAELEAALADVRARIVHVCDSVLVSLPALPADEDGAQAAARALLLDTLLREAETVLALAAELNAHTRALHALADADADATVSIDLPSVLAANDACGAHIHAMFAALPLEAVAAATAAEGHALGDSGAAADPTIAHADAEDALVAEVDRLLAGHAVSPVQQQQLTDRLRRRWGTSPPVPVPAPRSRGAAAAAWVLVPVLAAVVGAAVLGPVGAVVGASSAAWIAGAAAVGATAGAGTAVAVQAVRTRPST
jgi:hypothetical protein